MFTFILMVYTSNNSTITNDFTATLKAQQQQQQRVELEPNSATNKEMKSSMKNQNGRFFLILFIIGMILFEATTTTFAAPHSSSYPGYYSPLSMEGQNPEYLLQTIARLRQALIADDDLENSKRGLDLGLGRGFSGSQAAKHLMGLAAANFAGGPGRRRRSDEDA